MKQSAREEECYERDVSIDPARAKRGLAAAPAADLRGDGRVTCVRPPQPDPARAPIAEEPLHTGSIYRELMQKYDRFNSRHLK